MPRGIKKTWAVCALVVMAGLGAFGLRVAAEPPSQGIVAQHMTKVQQHMTEVQRQRT